MHYLYILLLSILEIHLWDLLPNYNPFVLSSLLFLTLYTLMDMINVLFLASKCKYTFSKYLHVWVLSCFSILRQFSTRWFNSKLSKFCTTQLGLAQLGSAQLCLALLHLAQLSSAAHLSLAQLSSAWLSLAQLSSA